LQVRNWSLSAILRIDDYFFCFVVNIFIFLVRIARNNDVLLSQPISDNRPLSIPFCHTHTHTHGISDPSKVEMRVLQQMRQRELNHEMRNLAAKLTPAERRAKRNAKLQEDTSRQVYVAVFRIKDFTDPKHRYFLIYFLHFCGCSFLLFWFHDVFSYSHRI
jgi:hypothetical protein